MNATCNCQNEKADTSGRYMRPLPVRKGSRVVRRYAIIVDGKRIGEIRAVRLKGRWAGHPNGIAHAWFASVDGKKYDSSPLNGRQEAAEWVARGGRQAAAE